VTEFAPEQLVALERFTRWLRDPAAPQIFSLFGHAGTGKTTVARQLKIIAAEHGFDVHFAAFTNKAVFVLRKKGCNPASTIHACIYTPDTPPRPRPRRIRRMGRRRPLRQTNQIATQKPQPPRLRP